jgi:hypothetical protein
MSLPGQGAHGRFQLDDRSVIRIANTGTDSYGVSGWLSVLARR